MAPAGLLSVQSEGDKHGGVGHRFKLDDYADALDALRSDRIVHKIIIEC